MIGLITMLAGMMMMLWPLIEKPPIDREEFARVGRSLLAAFHPSFDPPDTLADLVDEIDHRDRKIDREQGICKP